LGAPSPAGGETGTRKPQTSQIGYSSAAPIAHARRDPTKDTAIRKPSAAIVTTVESKPSAKKSGWMMLMWIPKRTRAQMSVPATQ